MNDAIATWPITALPPDANVTVITPSLPISNVLTLSAAPFTITLSGIANGTNSVVVDVAVSACVSKLVIVIIASPILWFFVGSAAVAWVIAAPVIAYPMTL